jgi:nitrate reductase NapD
MLSDWWNAKRKTMSNLCISSLVVQAKPALLDQVRDELKSIPEAEVMGESEQGKLVVVLDTRDNRQAADRITAIQNTAGVLSATLIYQYDDRFETQVEDSE